MRNELCSALVALSARHPFVFLTGDLGFMALEPLRDALGQRFVNAGVAEQNMVSVAAGVASEGMQAWAYSIAPFIYARPFEQIRNDICMQGLDVKLVGNGGGYAYGPMGPTHHALEDYGTLLALRDMRVFVPAFAADVPTVVEAMASGKGPAYLRLGRCELPAGTVAPAYAPWRRLVAGGGDLIVTVGPLAGGIMGLLLADDATSRPELWCIAELPVAGDIPEAFLSAASHRGVLVVEEHVAAGGAGMMVAQALLERGCRPAWFARRGACGYPSGRHGSQQWHRRESGIDAASVVACARAGGRP